MHLHERKGGTVSDEMLRLPEVLKRTGLSSWTLNRMEKAGEFPMRRKLGRRSVGWLASDVDKWVAATARSSSTPMEERSAQVGIGGGHA